MPGAEAAIWRWGGKAGLHPALLGPHLFMAAMACWSSSFSACTVPSRRQASALLGLRWHSASSASTASEWVGAGEGRAGGINGRREQYAPSRSMRGKQMP